MAAEESKMDPQMEALKGYVNQTIRDVTAWTAERMYQDPNHEIKKRRRKAGGHIPSARSRTRSRRASGEDMRSLTHEDVSAFEAAAEERRPAKTSSRSIEGLFSELWTTDYWRMRRLRKDMKWIRKEAEKRGIQPWSIPWNDI